MAAEVSSAFASLFRDLVRVELNRQGVVHSDKFICAAVQRLRVTGPNVRISLDGLEMGDKETIAVAETLIKLVSRTMLASHGVGRCDLGLAHNNLTDMSVPHLCMLVSRCPLLTLLDVRANSISPAGAQHIEEARLSSSSHCVVQLDSLRAAGANKGANTQASCSLPSSVLSRSASRQRGIDEEALQRRRSALFKGGKSAAPSSVVDSEKNLNGGYAREDVLSAKDGNLPVKEVIHQSGNTVGGSRPSTARADQCLERPATREVRPKVVDEPPGKVSARGGVGVDEATTVAQDCNTLGNVSPITTESAKSTNINECSIDVTENLSPLLQSVMDLTDSVSSGKLRTIYGTDDIWSVIRSNTTTGWNSPTKVDDLSSPITAVSNSLYQSVTVLCIGYNGLKSLDALPSTLIRLDVSNNELSSLSGLSECKMLTLLNARHNQLTCISGLEQNLSLSHLFLGNNKISFVDGIAHLFLLETLDLGHNKLKTQSAVRPLSLCRSLRHLVLRGNPVVESMKKCYHPVLRNLCPSLMFIDGARLHSSQLSNSGRTQSSHEAVDGARGAGAALALASENKDGTCTADYMSLLTRGVRVGTDVGGYSDPAQTSRAAKAMASYNKSKEEAKARQQRAHRSGGKVLREEMVNKIATKSKEYLESVLVERLASAQSSHILSDLSTLTAASESGILEDTGGTRLPTRCLSAPGRRPGGEYHGVIELDVDDVEECVHMQQRKQECRGANKVQGKRVISPARASSVGRRRQEVGAAAGGSPSCADSYGSGVCRDEAISHKDWIGLRDEVKKRRAINAPYGQSCSVVSVRNTTPENSSGEQYERTLYISPIRGSPSESRVFSANSTQLMSTLDSLPARGGHRCATPTTQRGRAPLAKANAPTRRIMSPGSCEVAVNAQATTTSRQATRTVSTKSTPQPRSGSRKQRMPPPSPAFSPNAILTAKRRECISAKWVAQLQEDTDAVQQALQTIVTLISAQKSAFLSSKHQTTCSSLSLHQERQKCVQIIKDCGMLCDTEVPLEVVRHYGFSAEELNHSGDSDESLLESCDRLSDDVAGMPSPVRERKDVLNCIRAIGDAKTCLRYIVMLIEERKDKALYKYVEEVTEFMTCDWEKFTRMEAKAPIQTSRYA